MSMRVKRVISNNAVLATDDSLQEIVALGRVSGTGAVPATPWTPIRSSRSSSPRMPTSG